MISLTTIIVITIIIIINIIIIKGIKHTILIENSITDSDRNTMMNGLMNMKYYINFSRHYMLFNLLQILTKLFDDNHIEYFIICGALIGYHRHNKGFIPWDDDIDIGVFEKDSDKITQIINEYCNDNARFILTNKHGIYKFIYNNSNTDKTMIMIDIFMYKYLEDKMYYHYYTPKLQRMFPREYITSDEIYPLIPTNFVLYLPDGKEYDTVNINIPNKSTEYLDRVYPNWINDKKVSTPHNTYYRYLFSNII